MNKNTRNALIALAVALAGVGAVYFGIKGIKPANASGNNNNNAGGGNNTGGNTNPSDGGDGGDGLAGNNTGDEENNNEGEPTPVIPTFNPIISVTPTSYNANEDDGTLTITGSGFPPNSIAFGYVNGTSSFSGGVVNPYKTDANGKLNTISRLLPGTKLGQNTLVVKTAATTSLTPVTSTSNTTTFTVFNNQTGDPDNPPVVEPTPTPRVGTGYDVKGNKTFPSVDLSGDIDTPQKQIAKAEDNLISYPSNTVPELNLRTLWNVRRNLYGVLLSQDVGYQTAAYNAQKEEYDKLNPYPTASTKARGADSGWKDNYGKPIIVGTPFIDNNGAWAVLLPSDLAPYNWIPAWNLPSGYPTLAAIMASA